MRLPLDGNRSMLLCHGLADHDVDAVTADDDGYAVDINNTFQRLLHAPSHREAHRGRHAIWRIGHLTLVDAGSCSSRAFMRRHSGRGADGLRSLVAGCAVLACRASRDIAARFAPYGGVGADIAVAGVAASAAVESIILRATVERVATGAGVTSVSAEASDQGVGTPPAADDVSPAVSANHVVS
jgi:hypothetical protein